ncbi:MAG: AraC family transcriptional regulator [Dysgonomonas sp.]|nr:AraC family transcriptional regulator [Dysgonomonas sp.]
MEKKLSKLSFDYLNEIGDPFMIKNFILADSSQAPTDVTFDYPFTFDGIIFGICLKGESVVKINFKEYVISKNTIFTILPNEILETVKRSDDFFVEVLLFSFDFVNGLSLTKDFDVLANIARNPCVMVDEMDMKDLMQFHSFIVKSYNRTDNVFRVELTKSLLQVLLTILGSIYADKKKDNEEKLTTRHEEIAEQFFKLLIEHHKTERNASFYADKMCITTKYLSGVLKKITGSSINAIINHAVIIEAKLLLKSSKMTVLQISEELNFPNPSFFGRFFKQYTGMTPVQYRES